MTQIFRKVSTIEYILLSCGFAFIAFFTLYHLFDSPEPWMDEGLIIQSAVGLLNTGKAALPVAPGVFEPAWYITTGFPLTIPLAAVFAVSGVSFEAARVVMAFFLFSFFVVLLFYARRAIGGGAAWLGFFFLVFFGPLYGHGRNVLGEIPGLLFILLALLPLVPGGALSAKRAFYAGVGAGLAAATKPIFILFLPALLLVLLVRHRELELKKVLIYGFCGALLPLTLWFVTQFGAIDVGSVLAVYANPHELSLAGAVKSNLALLFTELKPFYFIAALGVWLVSYGVRRIRREAVTLTEEVLLVFSVLVLLAYLRSAGFYRYFFPAQVFALLYLPYSLQYVAALRGQLVSRGAIVFIALLLVFQAYETSFRSWTATHYSAVRTDALAHYVAGLPEGKELFVYQAPEVVPFAVAQRVYQFVQITPSLSAGGAYRSRVLDGTAEEVITPVEFYGKHRDEIFSRYTRSREFDSYITLVPKQGAL